MPSRAIQSLTISFGLVAIPVKLYTATSSEAVSFNLLHKKCGGRLKQQYLCPAEQEVVERSDIVRGYEYAKNQYVLFSEEELEAIESAKTDQLEILEFVPLGTVDLIYVAKTYYVGPDKGGDKAYHLLSEAMQRTEKVAIGRLGTRGREQLVLVRPYKRGLLLHYVYYANEVRSFEQVDTGASASFTPTEIELADKLIEQLTSGEFHPERYHDDYSDRIHAAVEQKVAGSQVTTVPEQPAAQVIDLFEALKRSVESEAAARELVEPRPPKKTEGRRPGRARKRAAG